MKSRPRKEARVDRVKGKCYIDCESSGRERRLGRAAQLVKVTTRLFLPKLGKSLKSSHNLQLAMASPFQERTFIPANPTPTPRGRPRGAASSAAKRGRKPRAGTLDSPLATSLDVLSNPSPAPSAATSPATTTPI